MRGWPLDHGHASNSIACDAYLYPNIRWQLAAAIPTGNTAIKKIVA
jgi:hypothetical protein